MGSKKKSETTSSSTTTAAPPSWTMPGIQDASAKVTQALGTVSALPAYTGGFVAQPNTGLVDAAIGGYKDAAAAVPGAVQQMQGSIDSLGAVKPVTTGSYDVGGAYDLTGAINAATAPIYKQLQEQTLPGLRSSALESGAYTGDRAMSVVPTQVIGNAINDAQNTAATIGLQDYTNREQRRLAGYQTDQGNALDAAKYNNTFTLNSAQLMPDLLDEQMKLRASVGDLNTAALGLDTQRQQAGIDNNLAANDYAIKYPFQGLDIASALLSQLSGNYGTTSQQGQTTNVQSSSGLGNVVQGLAGLASAAGSFAMPGGGTLLGSLFKKSGSNFVDNNAYSRV